MKQKYMLQGYACREAIIPEELRNGKPGINYDNKVAFQQEVQHHADSRCKRKELTNNKVTKK